jgi:hypothetical protein
VIGFAVNAWTGFSALAYDWDHQSEMDVLLAADKLETEHLLDRVELERHYTSKSKTDLKFNFVS